MTVLCRSNENVVALVNVSDSGVASDALLVQYGIYPHSWLMTHLARRPFTAVLAERVPHSRFNQETEILTY